MAVRISFFVSVCLLAIFSPSESFQVYAGKINGQIVAGTKTNSRNGGQHRSFKRSLIGTRSQWSKSANVTADVLLGVNKNAQGDLLILESTFITNSLLYLAVTAAFCFLVRLYPAVYNRTLDKEKFETPPPAGFWEKMYYYSEWLRDVYSGRDEDVVIKEAGLDGLMFLKYQDLMRWMLLALGPPIVTVLCPMHYIYGMNSESVDKLSRLGINNLHYGSKLFWVHVVFVYYVVIIAVLFILDAQRKFVTSRYQWLKDEPLPKATTMLVEGIPYRFRSESKLKHFFEDACAFGKDAVERVYMIRQAGMLYVMVDKVSHANLSILHAKQSGDDEAVKELEAEKQLHEEVMDKERQKIHERVQAGKDAEGKKNPLLFVAQQEEQQKVEDDVGDEDQGIYSAAAFVTFTTRNYRRKGLKEQYSAYAEEFVCSPAVEPSDVYWSNLALLPLERENLDFIGRLCVAGIFVAWLPAVISILSLTDLRSLQNKVPWVGELCDNDPALEAVLEGVFATWALKLFMGLLPTILLYIIRYFFTSNAGAHAQYHMHSLHFIFQVIFVVLVTAIGKSLFYTAKIVAEQPSTFLDVIALSMPTSSHFYLQYVILGWFGVALEQLRISNLLKFKAFSLFMDEAKAKERSEPEADTTYGMGTRFANSTTYATIFFCFCTCSPTICIFAWVYFRLASITYTYLLCKAETKKPDLGGLFWVQALRQTFVGLVIFVLLMVGILEERASTYKEGIIASGALCILYWGWVKVNSVEWLTRSLPAVVADDKALAANPAGEIRCGEYVDPHLLPLATAEAG